MKIWYQHGSEHSANLVMIGRFKSASDATTAKEIIDVLTRQVRQEESDGIRIIGSPSERYEHSMRDLLGELNIASIGSRELEQFVYDVSVKVQGNDVVLTTEELDISAFLKVMVLKGARIEVYSTHDYPDDVQG